MQVIPPPKAATSIEEFYTSYWRRVRPALRLQAEGSVRRALTGRFEHIVTFCPDGVLVLHRHASTDSFVWAETSQGVLDLIKESFGSPESWIALEVDQLVPGQQSFLNFDLDIACRTDSEEPHEELEFHRLQLRYVPFSFDPQFWGSANAERLAARHLKGPAI